MATQQSMAWDAGPSHGAPLTPSLAQVEPEVEFSKGTWSFPREDPYLDGITCMPSRPGFK